MSEKRVIELDSFIGLGLIILHPSGAIYTNQVAGNGCFHPEVEGVFVPLETDVNRYELNTLQQYFTGSWHSLNEPEANLVDTVLQRSRLGLDWISVDRSRLKDSFEAWVYVKLNPKKGRMLEVLTGFDDSLGILVWPNSD
jgi:hypothetical protein